MKMGAFGDFIAKNKDIHKVYLINQDYSFGKSVAAAAHKMLAEKRPDMKIVGDELHPLQKVQDFSPYVAKIKASGADTVITGNWSNDMLLLFKAGKDAGLKVNWYTYYGGGLGSVPAIGHDGVGYRQAGHRAPQERAAGARCPTRRRSRRSTPTSPTRCTTGACATCSRCWTRPRRRRSPTTR